MFRTWPPRDAQNICALIQIKVAHEICYLRKRLTNHFYTLLFAETWHTGWDKTSLSNSHRYIWCSFERIYQLRLWTSGERLSWRKKYVVFFRHFLSITCMHNWLEGWGPSENFKQSKLDVLFSLFRNRAIKEVTISCALKQNSFFISTPFKTNSQNSNRHACEFNLLAL